MHPDAKPLDAEKVLTKLDKHGVECVVIGSYGAIMHGVPLTETDIDLVPKLTKDNVRALAKALIDLGVDERHGASPAVVRFLQEMPEFITSNSIWVVLTDHGEVDITMRPGGFPGGYDDLVDNAEDVGGGSTVLIASLEDIKRSKEVAGREKDREALEKFPDIPRSRPPIPLPPLPIRDELTMRMRSASNKGGLVLRPTTDRRTGKTVMRWMRP